MKFITYGTNKILVNYKYREDGEMTEISKRINKPVKGIWACPTNTCVSWRDFANWRSRSYFKKSVEFTVKHAKILVLDSEKSLKKAFEKYGYFNEHYSECEISDTLYTEKKFDWEGIQKDFDGVFVNISKLSKLSFRLNRELIDEYSLGYWDVDSLCIWNLKKIKTK